MKKINTRSVILSLATLVMFVILSAQSHAAKYFYFADLEGLVLDEVNDESPFPVEEAEEEEVGGSVNVSMDGVLIPLNATSPYASSPYALSGENAGNAVVNVVVKADLNNIIGSAVEENGNLKITGSSATFNVEGEALVRLEARVDGALEGYKDVSVSVYSCHSSNPLSGFDVEGDVYLIGGTSGNSDLAKEQLLCISQNQNADVVSKDYKLMADVIFPSSESTVDWDGNGSADGSSPAGWIPLGGGVSGDFTGSFDGDYHKISYIYVNRTSSTYQGFFGNTNGATISNLGLENVYVRGGGRVGGLAGNLSNATVSNVYVTGYVNSSGNYLGGICGGLSSSTLDASYSSASVYMTGGNYYATGGITGSLQSSAINNSYSTGRVSSAYFWVGGLVGYMPSGTINDSYATGYVSSSSSNVGGLVGHFSGAINNSYAYWSSTPSGTTSVGALVGLSDGGVINNYNNKCEKIGTTSSYYCANNSSKVVADIRSIKADLWSDDVWENYYDEAPKLEWEDASSEVESVVTIDVPSACISSDPFDGMGQEGDTYVISTADQLLCISQVQDQLPIVLAESYKLANDISFPSDESTVDWDGDGSADGSSPAGWIPLGGGLAGTFTGNFDGDGHKISYLYINRSSESYQGFFGKTSSAVIENLGVASLYINGNSQVGGLVGNASVSTINNSYSTGNLTSSSHYLGGLIGFASNSSVINSSYSTATVTMSGETYNAGGLVGYLSRGVINNSYATGYINGTTSHWKGGLVGTLYSSSEINNSYSTGRVVGKYWVGGLAGSIEAGSTINNSYAYWSIAPSGTIYVGALIGQNNGGVINNYAGRCDEVGTIPGYYCAAHSSYNINSYIFSIQNSSWGDSGVWVGVGTDTTPQLNWQ